MIGNALGPGLARSTCFRPIIAAARIAGCPIVTGNARPVPEEAGVEVIAPAEIIAMIEKYR
jgi:hypothetical protein